MGTKTRLPDLVKILGDSQCTDLRDKIFALLAGEPGSPAWNMGHLLPLVALGTYMLGRYLERIWSPAGKL